MKVRDAVKRLLSLVHALRTFHICSFGLILLYFQMLNLL